MGPAARLRTLLALQPPLPAVAHLCENLGRLSALLGRGGVALALLHRRHAARRAHAAACWWRVASLGHAHAPSASTIKVCCRRVVCWGVGLVCCCQE